MIAVFLYICRVTVLQCYTGVKKNEYTMVFLASFGKHQEDF